MKRKFLPWFRHSNSLGHQLRYLSGSQGWNHWEYGTFPKQSKSKESDIIPDILPDDLFFWNGLSEEEVEESIQILSPYATVGRMQKFREIINQRTKRIRFVFENPVNANNTWAALRTFDSFGIQHVDVINDVMEYSNKQRLSGMRSAMGAQKWMTLRQHSSSALCIGELKSMGFAIYASDITPNSEPIDSLDWNSSKIAIVMGNEERGISDAVRLQADKRFFIPMKGFAESFNVASASAIITSTLAHRNALIPDLTSEEKNRVMLMWLARSIPGSTALLRRSGVAVKGHRVHTRMGKFTTK